MNELNDTVWATLGYSKIHGIGVITLKNIKQGEELTENYAQVAQGKMLFKYPFIRGKDGH